MDNYICPICRGTLLLHERSLVCPNRHSFDLSKEGYVNLLPANAKKSKDPGDNVIMMTARRAFLEAGYYKSLADKISEIMGDLKLGENSSFLDLGCGEGYYSGCIRESFPSLNMFGVDISKTAVRYASKKYKDVGFFVASAFDLPLADDQIDLLLRVYAPSLETELHRVIKKDGYLITVTPGERHLYELRDIIYTEVHKHTEEVKEIGGFELHQREKLTYDLDLKERDMVKNLLEMTPFGWKISVANKEFLLNKTHWEVECDFNIDIYRRLK